MSGAGDKTRSESGGRQSRSARALESAMSWRATMFWLVVIYYATSTGKVDLETILELVK